jgi:hypothetical protein
MPQKPDEKRPDLVQLLEELDRLQEEQQTLDLRDPHAVDECQRKIDALRQKIKSLDAARGPIGLV